MMQLENKETLHAGGGEKISVKRVENKRHSVKKSKPFCWFALSMPVLAMKSSNVGFIGMQDAQNERKTAAEREGRF